MMDSQKVGNTPLKGEGAEEIISMWFVVCGLVLKEDKP